MFSNLKMDAESHETVNTSTSDTTAMCSGDNANGVVSGSSCKCGEGAVANVGDHCTASTGTIVLKCVTSDVL